jgi:hypothetical protein
MYYYDQNDCPAAGSLLANYGLSGGEGGLLCLTSTPPTCSGAAASVKQQTFIA